MRRGSYTPSPDLHFPAPLSNVGKSTLKRAGIRITSDQPVEGPVVREGVMGREGNRRTQHTAQKCAIRRKHHLSL